MPPDPLPPDPASSTPRPNPAVGPHGITESPAELKQRQVHEKEQHQDAQGAAVGAAVGLGCLSFAFLPWIVGMLAVVAIILAGILHAHMHH